MAQTVIKQDRKALQYAAEELKADRDFMLEAVKKNGHALAHAAEELQADRDFMLEAVKSELGDLGEWRRKLKRVVAGGTDGRQNHVFWLKPQLRF